jgi:hypothetical protein
VAADEVPENDVDKGLVYDGLVAPTDGPCAGMFEFVDQPGICTHGPDLPPPDLSGTTSVEPLTEDGFAESTAAAVCDGDGVSGKRVEVLYVREAGKADRYNQYVSSFRTWIAGVDSIFQDSAAKTGGTRRVRWVTDSSCNVVVRNVQVQPGVLGKFSDTISALRSAGSTRTDRKYLMFADDATYCGIAQVNGDTRPGPENSNNGGPPLFGRVYNRCWNANVAAHELVHQLGAVARTAPNAGSRGGHCMDDYDLLCYNDGSGQPRIVCADRKNERLLDCNGDDYFNTNPRAGTWLARNWNIANSQFLVAGGGQQPPPPNPTPPPPPPTTVPPPPTTVPPPPTRALTVKGLASKCMDVRRSSRVDNTPVQLYTCNGTGAQRWTRDAKGRFQALGKCLDVEQGRNANGTKLVLWRCDDSGTQRFQVRGDALVHVPSGRCVDVPYGRTDDSTQLIIWNCHGGTNQRWSVS